MTDYEFDFWDEYYSSTSDSEDWDDFEDWDNLECGFDPYAGCYTDDC